MKTQWRDHPARIELLRLFEESDGLIRGHACECQCANALSIEDARCCQFGVTGREPYPTPVELCEVDHALRARGAPPTRPGSNRKKLPIALPLGACPLLSPEGRCTIYASRPFGCRTYFCPGHEPPRRAREAIQGIGRRISELAARFFPRDPAPRPFTRALAGPLPPPPPVARFDRGPAR